jgi:hypothetical protein
MTKSTEYSIPFLYFNSRMLYSSGACAVNERKVPDKRSGASAPTGDATKTKVMIESIIFTNVHPSTMVDTYTLHKASAIGR